MEYKTITIKEVFEAIEKNGFEHIRGQWYDNTYGKIGACLLGQAALNLGFKTDSITSIQDALNRFDVSREDIPVGMRHVFDPRDYHRAPLGLLLVHCNDSIINGGTKYRYTWKQLINIARKLMEPIFDKTVDVPLYKFVGNELVEVG